MRPPFVFAVYLWIFFCGTATILAMLGIPITWRVPTMRPYRFFGCFSAASHVRVVHMHRYGPWPLSTYTPELKLLPRYPRTAAAWRPIRLVPGITGFIPGFLYFVPERLPWGDRCDSMPVLLQSRRGPSQCGSCGHLNQGIICIHLAVLTNRTR